MIRFIVAVDSKNGMADDHGIPWDLPADKEYFRSKTIRSNVLMGYNTYTEFESPLPYRESYVVSKDSKPLRKGFKKVSDVNEFINKTKEDIWIIGGAKLFAEYYHLAKELYVTELQGDFKCTKFFPHYQKDFKAISKSELKTENNIPFRFVIYRRK